MLDKTLSKLLTSLHESKLFVQSVYLKFFCKLAIPKIVTSSLSSPVNKRNILCSGFLLTWVPVWDSANQVHSRVSNVNLTLYGVRGRSGGSGRRAPEIFPVFPDVD